VRVVAWAGVLRDVPLVQQLAVEEHCVTRFWNLFRLLLPS
jgi:CII-binding regulator of phage lambda lysogenization HflD